MDVSGRDSKRRGDKIWRCSKEDTTRLACHWTRDAALGRNTVPAQAIRTAVTSIAEHLPLLKIAEPGPLTPALAMF